VRCDEDHDRYIRLYDDDDVHDDDDDDDDVYGVSLPILKIHKALIVSDIIAQ